MRLVAERYVTWSDLEDMTIDDVNMLWDAIDLIEEAREQARRASDRNR